MVIGPSEYDGSGFEVVAIYSSELHIVVLVSTTYLGNINSNTDVRGKASI